MRKPDGKIVLLGDMNVGKTSLLQRYMERRFPDTVSTVGGAFYLKQWRSYNISIWDTAVHPGENAAVLGYEIMEPVKLAEKSWHAWQSRGPQPCERLKDEVAHN